MDNIKSVFIWLISILTAVSLFPVAAVIWLLVLPFDKNRSIVHWLIIYQSFIIAHLVTTCKITIEGRKKAIKGTTYVIISNHQSMIDTLAINCLRYRYKWISKAENMSVPLLGWYLRMADYIIVDRGNEESKAEMLYRSLKCLESGTSIMIFPEGTRVHNGGIGFFKRGAFQLAIDAKVPILPVLIDGTGNILPKNGLTFKKSKVNIRVLDPVYPSSFGTASAEELALSFSKMMSKEFELLKNK